MYKGLRPLSYDYVPKPLKWESLENFSQNSSFRRGLILGRLIAKFSSGILFLPVIEEAGGDIMESTDLGSSGGLAEKVFDDRTFNFWRKAPLVSHDKILSPHPKSKILSSL